MLSDPGVGIYSCPYWCSVLLPSDFIMPSAIPNVAFFGAQSLQLALTAYNVSCLRLAYCITTISPRLDTKCTGSVLSRQYFQLLVELRLVAHNKTCSLIVTVATMILALPGRITPTGNLLADACHELTQYRLIP